VVYSKNVCILHWIQHTATFTVYVIACDHKPSSSDTTAKLQDVYAFQIVCKYTVVKVTCCIPPPNILDLEMFQTAKVTFSSLEVTDIADVW